MHPLSLRQEGNLRALLGLDNQEKNVETAFNAHHTSPIVTEDHTDELINATIPDSCSGHNSQSYKKRKPKAQQERKEDAQVDPVDTHVTHDNHTSPIVTEDHTDELINATIPDSCSGHNSQSYKKREPKAQHERKEDAKVDPVDTHVTHDTNANDMVEVGGTLDTQHEKTDENKVPSLDAHGNHPTDSIEVRDTLNSCSGNSQGDEKEKIKAQCDRTDDDGDTPLDSHVEHANDSHDRSCSGIKQNDVERKLQAQQNDRTDKDEFTTVDVHVSQDKDSHDTIKSKDKLNSCPVNNESDQEGKRNTQRDTTKEEKAALLDDHGTTTDSHDSIIDIWGELRKSQERNAQLISENNQLQATLEQFNNATSEDESDKRIQDLQSEHEKKLQSLVEENNKQLYEVQSELEEKNAMIKVLEDDIGRCMSELMDVPEKGGESQTSLSIVPDKNTNQFTQLDHEEMMQMRKELEAKDLKIANINTVLKSYEEERLDFQEELKELNNRVVAFEESEKAWNKLEVGFVMRIRTTEREKVRMEKKLRSELKLSEEMVASLRAQLESSANTTPSSIGTKSVHFSETSFVEAEPNSRDKQSSTQTNADSLTGQRMKALFAKETSKTLPGDLFENKNCVKIKFFEPLDCTSKQPTTDISETANKDESEESSHNRDDASSMSKSSLSPPTAAGSETSDYNSFSGDSILEGLTHKESIVSALTPVCVETDSDSNCDSFSNIVTKIFSETSTPPSRRSTIPSSKNLPSGKVVCPSRKHGSFGKGFEATKADLAKAASAISKDTKAKMKILTQNPKLWLKFKARLSSSYYGTGPLAVQTVLRELIEEHPEIEDMFAAKEQQRQKRLEVIAEIKKNEANESSITRRFSTFVSSMYPLSQSSEQIDSKGGPAA